METSSQHMFTKFLLLWGISTTVLTVTTADVISADIGPYEELRYKPLKMPPANGVSPGEIRLLFTAFNRQFDLRLQQDESIFTLFADLMTSQGDLTALDTSHIYEGYLFSDSNSRVHGSLISGVFAGTIITPEGTYYIQRMPQQQNGFHSIIYRDSGTSHTTNTDKSDIINESQGKMPKVSLAGSRTRRAVEQLRSCSMLLQADPQLWTRMTSQLGYSDKVATQEIVALMASHVNNLKAVFENVAFPSTDTTYEGMTFTISRVKILKTEETCPEGSFCDPVADPEVYIDALSKQDHNDYCLAYSFTYQDFAPNGPQLAKQGHPDSTDGGVCARYEMFFERGRGFFRVMKTQNVGVVSLLHHGVVLTPKQSNLAFIRAVGCSFGANGDDLSAECAPGTVSGSSKGDFLMFSGALTGDSPNNNKLSPCSKRQIGQVLDAIFQEKGRKKNCFVVPHNGLCGNLVVDQGEQCDCGALEECTETCCNPSTCRLRLGAVCSPSTGPCCTDSCQYTPKGEKCSEETDCAATATCSEKCEPSILKPDMGPCNRETQICRSGVCQGSVCERIGWEPCHVTYHGQSTLRETQLCYVACQNPTTGRCISSNDAEQIALTQNEAMRTLVPYAPGTGAFPVPLLPGSPCGVGGVCDESRVCSDLCASPVCEAVGWEECDVAPSVVYPNGTFVGDFLCNLGCVNPVTSKCVNSGNRTELAHTENQALKIYVNLCAQRFFGRLAGSSCGLDGMCDEDRKCNATGVFYSPEVPEEVTTEEVTTEEAVTGGLKMIAPSLHILTLCIIVQFSSMIIANGCR